MAAPGVESLIRTATSDRDRPGGLSAAGGPGDAGPHGGNPGVSRQGKAPAPAS
jgi:hypothetical protein